MLMFREGQFATPILVILHRWRTWSNDPFYPNFDAPRRRGRINDHQRNAPQRRLPPPSRSPSSAGSNSGDSLSANLSARSPRNYNWHRQPSRPTLKNTAMKTKWIPKYLIPQGHKWISPIWVPIRHSTQQAENPSSPPPSATTNPQTDSFAIPEITTESVDIDTSLETTLPFTTPLTRSTYPNPLLGKLTVTAFSSITVILGEILAVNIIFAIVTAPQYKMFSSLSKIRLDYGGMQLLSSSTSFPMLALEAPQETANGHITGSIKEDTVKLVGLQNKPMGRLVRPDLAIPG